MSAPDDDAPTAPSSDAPGDASADAGNTGNVDMGASVWSYRQRRARGSDRTYDGHIRYVDGEYGEKLRGELAGIITDLLNWAATRHNRDRREQDHCEAA